jgi:hypothetical protein
VPIGICDIEIDNVAPRNTTPDEREVVVAGHGGVFFYKDVSVP